MKSTIHLGNFEIIYLRKSEFLLTFSFCGGKHVLAHSFSTVVFHDSRKAYVLRYMQHNHNYNYMSEYLQQIVTHEYQFIAQRRILVIDIEVVQTRKQLW